MILLIAANLLLFFALVLLSVFVFFDARAQGMTEFWALLTFFLPLLGFLIYLIARSGKAFPPPCGCNRTLGYYQSEQPEESGAAAGFGFVALLCALAASILFVIAILL